MKSFFLPLLAFVLLAISGCENPKDEKNSDNYKVCLDNFFTGIPLGNCGSYASSDVEKRRIKTYYSGEKLMVEIEINECLHELELYHKWLASEVQASCLENNASKISFTNGSSKIYHSFNAEKIPNYLAEGNRDLYVDPTISEDDEAKLKTVLFNNALPSETTHYISKDENGVIHVALIQYLQEGNDSFYEDLTTKLSKLSNHFKSLNFQQKVAFHAMEQYGRIILNL